MEKRKIEIFIKSKLPKKGWIQGCFCCEMPTSRTIEYKKIKNDLYNFVVFVCKDCEKGKELEKNEKQLIKYINTKYELLL